MAQQEEISLKRFQRRIEEKYKVKFDDYWQFHKWTVEHYEEMWAECFEFFEIVHSRPYTKVLEKHEKLEDATEWFVGARLNFSENMLRSEGVALLLLGEERECAEEITFKQLRDEVATLTSALRKFGVKPGDVIGCYLSTRKETVVVKLAAGALGAIFAAMNPLIGVEAVTSRLGQVSPKVLFTIDRHLYNKEEKNTLKDLPDIIKGIPGLELVVIVPSNDDSLLKDISHVKKSCFYPKFMATGLKEDGNIPEPYYEQLPFSHPYIMSFTSGTSGPSKVILHSAGAALLAPIKEMCFMFDIRPGDVAFLVHLPGWATFSCLIVNMAVGSSTIIYEGMPYYNDKPSYWDIIDKYKVTTAFLTPTVLETMNKMNIVPGPHNSLKSFRMLASGSSPVLSYVYDIVHDRIGKDFLFCSFYGVTEYFGLLGGASHGLAVHKEEIPSIALGIDMLCYNELGESVYDQHGELVIVNPWPSQPLSIYKNGKHQKYSGIAVEKFPGKWWIGDICMRKSKTRGLVIPGRCDDTVKNFGARYGSAEIYNIVNSMEEVDDSICVSRIIKSGHEVAVLFIKMKIGNHFDADFEQRVRKKIKEELSLMHVPHIIVPVKGIPLNFNGKRIESLVKLILSGAKKVNTGALRNPECLPEYIDYAKSTY